MVGKLLSKLSLKMHRSNFLVRFHAVQTQKVLLTVQSGLQSAQKKYFLKSQSPFNKIYKMYILCSILYCLNQTWYCTTQLLWL